jgi:hypothetical protein
LEQSLLEVRTETKCSSAELTMLEAWLQVKWKPVISWASQSKCPIEQENWFPASLHASFQTEEQREFTTTTTSLSAQTTDGWIPAKPKHFLQELHWSVTHPTEFKLLLAALSTTVTWFLETSWTEFALSPTVDASTDTWPTQFSATLKSVLILPGDGKDGKRPWALNKISSYLNTPFFNTPRKEKSKIYW